MDWVGYVIVIVVGMVGLLYQLRKQARYTSWLIGYGTPPDLELHKTDYFFQLPDATPWAISPEDQAPPHVIPPNPARPALPASDAVHPPQQPQP
jgi:hypothetical protein